MNLRNIWGEVKNVPRIKCNLGVIEYTTQMGGIKIDNVCIYDLAHEEEAEKAIHDLYTPYAITMYQEQYETLFKPLFENISATNKAIASFLEKPEENKE